MSMDKTALTLSLIALASGGNSGSQGLPGADANKWHVIGENGEASDVPIGAKEGDLVLDAEGKIYFVRNGDLLYSGVSIKGDSGETVYEYAVNKCGYKGSQADFDLLFTELISKSYVNQEAIGGIIESYFENHIEETVFVLDGGRAAGYN